MFLKRDTKDYVAISTFCKKGLGLFALEAVACPLDNVVFPLAGVAVEEGGPV